jgi:hypothetical protein
MTLSRLSKKLPQAQKKRRAANAARRSSIPIAAAVKSF